MLRNVKAGCRCALTTALIFIVFVIGAPPAGAGSIVADFEGNIFGQFVPDYEEAGIMFTSDGGAGLSFFENLSTGDMGLFEATAFGPIGVNAQLPAMAQSVTVSFFLAHDDFVTLTAYDTLGSVVDVISAPGPGSFLEYLTLTVDTTGFDIARIHWIGSTDTLLVAGEVSANVVPAPGALAMLAIALTKRPRTWR